MRLSLAFLLAVFCGYRLFAVQHEGIELTQTIPNPCASYLADFYPIGGPSFNVTYPNESGSWSLRMGMLEKENAFLNNPRVQSSHGHDLITYKLSTQSSNSSWPMYVRNAENYFEASTSQMAAWNAYVYGQSRGYALGAWRLPSMEEAKRLLYLPQIRFTQVDKRRVVVGEYSVPTETMAVWFTQRIHQVQDQWSVQLAFFRKFLGPDGEVEKVEVLSTHPYASEEELRKEYERMQPDLELSGLPYFNLVLVYNHEATELH